MKKLLTILALTILPLCCWADKEAYAISDENSGTLTFKYGERPEGPDIYLTDDTGTTPPWSDRYIQKVIFDPSFAEARPSSTASWFYNANSMTEITGIQYLNTSNVTNMSNMFYFCCSLKSLDVSHFDTSNVTDMNHMFYYCTSLESLDISGFDFNKVTDTSYMFAECYLLVNLNIPSFDFDNISNTDCMFESCPAFGGYAVFDSGTGTLTFKYGFKPSSEYFETDDTGGDGPDWSQLSIKEVVFDPSFAKARPKSTCCWFAFAESLTEIKGFQYLNTSNVTNMRGMFSGSNFSSLELSHFDTSNVTDMSWMFSSCESLTSVDLSHFNTSNVTDMSGMFDQCYSLLSLDLSHFNTSNVTDMRQIFYQCYDLTSLDISNFDVSNTESLCDFLYDANNLIDLKMDHFKTSEKLKDLSRMFFQCTNLKSIDLSGFNTSNVEDMNNMFKCCFELTNLDLSSFDTKNVKNMSGMFGGCWSITSLDLSHFDTKKVTDMSGMFSACENLVSLDISSFDTGNVENMDGMFDFCRSLAKLDITNFNTSKVKSMETMFRECWVLTTLDLSSFDTSNVETMEDMFSSCTSLTKLDITNFNTSKVKSMETMFIMCVEMPTLDLTSFDTRSLEKSNGLFNSCRKLNKIYVSNHWNLTNILPPEIDPYAAGGEFYNCWNLIGGQGTNYETYINTDIKNFDFCRIDGGPSAPGLLTAAHQEEGVTYTIEGSSATIINGSGQNEDVEIPSDMCIEGQTVAVTTISEDAFKDSYKLKIVSIPESIEGIGANAFAGCSDLKSIYCYAEEPIALASDYALVRTRADGNDISASSVFDKVNKNDCILFVPASSIDKYKNAAGWKEFARIERIPSDVKGDANGDWTVNQLDAKAVSDYIMTNEQSTGFVWRNADANGDMKINVADIVTITNTKP